MVMDNRNALTWSLRVLQAVVKMWQILIQALNIKMLDLLLLTLISLL